jgi:Domain of unknown function (DUF4124)
VNLARLLVAVAFVAQFSHAATVYRWVDENGVIHITSEKPPPGVRAERLELPTAKRGTSPPAQRAASAAQAAPVSPARAAERAEVLDSLRNRECVVALEALDRKTSATEPTSAAELRRLQQTVEANCSSNPVRRREQEDLAARLRVANGPTCIEARDRLSQMLDGSTEAERGAVRAQQRFVDDYCTPPVR